MASGGQRNKSALYKPTDFVSKNRVASLSNSKMEEQKVVKKIQQRPTKEEKTSTEDKNNAKDLKTTGSETNNNNNNNENKQIIENDGSKEIKPVLNSPAKEEKKDKAESKKPAEKTKKNEESVVGVSEKDADKIKKLQEYMAKMNASEKGNTPNKYKPQNQRGGFNNRNQQQHSGSRQKNDKRADDNANKNNKQDMSRNKQNQRNQHHSRNVQDGIMGPGGPGFYGNAPFPPGVPPNELQWMQMRYAAMGVAGAQQQSILGTPYTPQPPAYFNNKQQQDLTNTHQKFTPQQQQQPENNPALAAAAPTTSDTSAPTDKDEQKKKSLDFVKNFFNNDPEVQYLRKHAEEKRAAQKANQAANNIPQSQNVAEPNHQQNRVLLNNNAISQIQQNAALYQQHQQHQNLYSGRNSAFHNNMMHPETSAVQHANIPPGLSSNPAQHPIDTSLYNSFLPQHQQQQSNYHNMSHQHHQQHLQQHQANTANIMSPNSSQYQQSMYNSVPGMENFLQYPNNFSSRNTHVGHAQQQLDPNVMTEILMAAKHNKNWQKQALDKCGPIDSSQARSLITQLIDGTYECMICCDSIKWKHQIWHCTNCYHIFHLNCIKQWARSETALVKDESGWRCPGCQNVSRQPPNKYYCFCGKVQDPDFNPRDGITPHSCGEVCKKKRWSTCDHGCNEMCHPGPCPTCPMMVTRYCPCTKTSTKLRCGQAKPTVCDNTCLKMLACGKHKCQLKCHEGACEPCEVKHSEACFCGKDRRFVMCGTGQELTDKKPEPTAKCQRKYSCAQPCGKDRKCKNHKCEALCHIGSCPECPLLPNNITFCPCGKVPVVELTETARKSCLDEIPTCESFCGKKLSCGPKGFSHLCMQKCHTGECKPCEKTTVVHCRCGQTEKEINCKELVAGEAILCERKCNKKRKCGRHKCNQKCCTDHDHACNIICAKKLSCGMHKCDEVCHPGFCPPCWRAGFDELACLCGHTVLYPPIACGTKPPECDQPCSRLHPCGHQPQHPCHSEDTCPPCTVLTSRQCMGGHEMWKQIPCHVTDVSCGRKCVKKLACGLHTCIKKCHKGLCEEANIACSQACPIKRRDCSHPCGAVCHVGEECPNTPCKAQILIHCRCKRLSANALCLAGNVNSNYHSFNAEVLSCQLRNLKIGTPIDISALTSTEKRPKYLDCDEECSRIERNTRLAEALGIENSGSGHFQHAQFSLFLQEQAKIQFPFIQMLEALLETLILRLKKNAKEQLHHAFAPMNLNQRKIIHELAETYNCKTYSQDQEPKRNTVVVATKESFIPQVKLSVLIEREIKQRTNVSFGSRTQLPHGLGTSAYSMLHIPPIEKPNNAQYFEADFTP